VPEARYWIEKLKLQPHPEGGYFRESYRAALPIAQTALPAAFKGARSASTAIYFLLDGANFSAFHRLPSDELWHFYDGGTLLVYVIDPKGALSVLRLGRNLEAGEQFQAVVPAGCWFGSRLEDPKGYALVGCTVAPGFDFADFEMADRECLLVEFPQHAEIILRLTRTRE
jgi:predicted cupin superfamily sugar epimerase